MPHRKMKNKVMIDARMWSSTGIGTYLRSFVKELVKFDDFDWAFLGAPDELKTDLPGSSVIPCSAPIYSVKEQLEVGMKAKGADLLHVPHYNAPLLARVPMVVTVHDLTHFRFPEYFGSRLKVELARFQMRSVVRKARLIIAVSKATRDDLVRLFGAEETKVRVIHEGPGNIIPEIPVSSAHALKLPEPYLLFIGNLKPHKNVTRLLEAYVALKREGLKESLVVVGRVDEKGPEAGRIRVLLREPGIRHITSLRPGWLPELYRRSAGLVFPSLWEGFGLPILEAFQAGIPVACSRIPSHEEIVGEKGLYFDPRSPQEIRQSIRLLVSDERVREHLVENGQKRLQLFSWHKTALETLDAYREALAL